MKEKKAITLDNVMDSKNKSCGKNTVATGKNIIYNPARIPSGIFAVDLCLAGGIPLWGSTCLWGPKGGAKSTLAIKLIKASKNICWRCFNQIPYCTCSKKALKMKPVVADIEGTLDIDWMASIGVNREDYYLILGDSAEEAFDVAESCLQADDCGLLVIDSLGGSETEAEMEKSLIDSNMGKHPQMITRTVKKLKQRLIREKKRLHPCSIVYTNQMRFKLKQQFGNKESMPGGCASFHEYSLVLRCNSIALTEADKKKFVDPDREIKQVSRQNIKIMNHKVTIFRGAADFILAKENILEHNLRKGDVDDLDAMVGYGRTLGIFYQEKTKWKILNDDKNSFSTLTDLYSYLGDYNIRMKLQKDIITKFGEKLK